MLSFLQEARLKVVQILPPSAPEIEIRIGVVGRSKFLQYLETMKGAEIPEPTFVQRCDIHYSLALHNQPKAGKTASSLPLHQCRIEFSGTKKLKTEFMTKTALLEVFEEGAAEERRKLVLAEERALNDEQLPSSLSLCFLKTRCMFNFAHWRVEFVVTHEIEVLTIVQIVANRNVHFATPIKTLDDFVAYVRNDILVFKNLAIEYELLPPAVAKMNSMASIAPILEEVMLIDRIIFAQDGDAIRYRSILREAYGFYARGGDSRPDALTIKNATVQAKTMTSKRFRDWPFTGWFITEKTDGVHAIVYVAGPDSATPGAIFLLAQTLLELAPGSAVGKATDRIVPNTTIVDGEYLADAKGGARFVIFDVLMFEGMALQNMPFAVRVGYIDEAVAALEKMTSKVHFAKKTFTALCDAKLDSRKYGEQINAIYQESQARDYKTDGLMYISPDAPYWETQILKWKPSSMTTIDFLAKTVPESIRSSPPFRIIPGMTQYILYCTTSQAERLLINEPTYVSAQFPLKSLHASFPTPFQSSLASNLHIFYSKDAALDGQIIELAPVWLDRQGRETNAEKAGAETMSPTERSLLRLGWRFERTRPERQADLLSGKYFGNYWRQAEQNLLTFVYPLTLENLKGNIKIYFEQQKEDQYMAMTRFNNLIKRSLFERYIKGHNTLLDLAAGRGSDINNYMNSVSQRIFACERDAGAIQELVFRKHSMFEMGAGRASENLTHRREMGRASEQAKRTFPGLFIVQQDLTRPAAETLSKLSMMGAPHTASELPGAASVASTQLLLDNATCFFAIHYLIATSDALNNMVKLVKMALKPGGHFIFTVFNQERVNELLDANGGCWIHEEAGRKRYHIERIKTPEIRPMIRLLLPFTRGQLIDEYLINMDEAIGAFKVAGFELVEKYDFSKKFYETADGFTKVAEGLSAGDKKFVSLNMVVVLKRK